MREARGEMPVGRKIGFTNRTIWAEYNVYGPIWGYIYNGTVHNLAEIGDTFSLMGLAEPRIEPEIVFKLALAPAPDMDETALLACIDWVWHGFEIVAFPDGSFQRPTRSWRSACTGALLIGPRHSIAAHAEDWSRTLSTFEIRSEARQRCSSTQNVLVSARKLLTLQAFFVKLAFFSYNVC